MGVLLCKPAYAWIIISCTKVICAGFSIKVFSAVSERVRIGCRGIFLVTGSTFQLHFSPIICFCQCEPSFEQKQKNPPAKAEGFFMVETAGLEPVTSTMRMSRSPR